MILFWGPAPPVKQQMHQGDVLFRGEAAQSQRRASFCLPIVSVLQLRLNLLYLICAS
jgi:hypothetical protein